MNRLSIQDVTLTNLKQINDSRGSVLHMLRNDDKTFDKFGECYFSEIFPNSVKAWKLHTIQTQNLAVPIGKVRFVLFDNRKNSNTKGEINIIELGRPEHYDRLTIPPNIWYGFQCISDSPALIVNCANFPHNREESWTIDFNDKTIPYRWTI